MFDHITLRAADIPADSNALTAVFDELEIKQSTSTPRLSVWGNFAITQTDDEHPFARRVHVAFIAPTPLMSTVSAGLASRPALPMTGRPTPQQRRAG